MKLFIVLSLVSASSAVAPSPCPPGAVFGVFKDRCFHPINTKTDFWNAERACISLDGHLAAVTNQFDNYLLSYQLDGPFWVGGSFNTLNWSWTSGHELNFTFWAQNEPKSITNHCLQVRKDQLWESVHCENLNNFFCETQPRYLPQVKCPTGFECFNNYAYGHFVPSKNWTYAEAHCQKLGGHLPSIHSAEEQAFVESILGMSAWIGAELVHKQEPRWIDGSKLVFKKWRIGNPVHVEEDTCVFMTTNNDAGWGNSFCGAEFPFVCKVPLNKLND